MNEASKGRRAAFFGGSFDPPHRGHLAVARAARLALGLDTVLFAPVGAQPLKPSGAAASFEDRVAMTRLALDGEPGCQVSLVDAPKPSGAPNYTLETLEALRSLLAPGSSLFCLMGADAFVGLREWRGSARIPFVAPLIVASRPGLALKDLKTALPAGLTMEPMQRSGAESSGIEVQVWLVRNANGDTAPFYLLPGLNVDVSATEIRGQVRAALASLAAGQELFPGAVAEYIRSHGLYC
jgi:nicotinate-nucleotide adenylyltransferase